MNTKCKSKISNAMQLLLSLCITHSSIPSNLLQFRKQTMKKKKTKWKRRRLTFEATILILELAFSCCLLHFLCKRCVAITIKLKCMYIQYSYANLLPYYLSASTIVEKKKKTFQQISSVTYRFGSSICLNVCNSWLCNLMVINCLQMDG